MTAPCIRHHQPAASPAGSAPHAGHGQAGHDHGAMVADFRRRFRICLPLTIGVVVLSRHIRMLVGLPDVLAFPGGTFVVRVLLGAPLAFTLERMVTVMVISCPHALGLAVPLVVAVSTELTARDGLLIRDRAARQAPRREQAEAGDGE